MELVKTMIDIQVRTEQAMAEEQRKQDILVGDFVAYRFSTPRLAMQTLSWTAIGIALVAEGTKAAIVATVVSWLLDGVELIPEDWSDVYD